MVELLAGLSIGLAAGVAPGPLQTLVITSTLRRGFGAGWRVAMAPLVTDIPIVALAVLAVGALPDGFVRGLGLVGGLVVVGFGLWELRSAREPLEPIEATAAGDVGDLWRGAAVNALSPHPWVFWVAAGAPLFVRAWDVASWRALAFVGGFWVTLIAAKVALAGVVAAGRHRLSDVWRRRLIVAGGVLLVVGGLVLVAEALRT
jgi:threonine/homoserine/homoserine lactone efflux protein